MLENYTNFGISWTVSTPGQNNWTAISISTNGKYQTAITDTGDIYISSDYGANRANVFNIGTFSTNTISISFTGQYQTASNGTRIYISSDYGSTWTNTFSNGTSNIYVSISLTGQYQTIVSSGDTVYLSSNYGITWNPLDVNSQLYDTISDSQNNLFQSVEMFPTVGVALSYNGMFQTVVAEFIYRSSDHGQSWINVSNTNGFSENNWIAVAMSSDGKYQTAVESGGDVYLSNDFGITWAISSDSTLLDKNWISVSISATGQYQTIVEQLGRVYCTNNYGNTWYPVPDENIMNKDFRSVSISSDAMYQCICEYSGRIYMSHLLATSSSCVCE
jgi:photosystem II stability/assembly factor-like uncharacterized protein